MVNNFGGEILEFRSKTVEKRDFLLWYFLLYMGILNRAEM